MKRIVLLAIVAVLTASTASAQGRGGPTGLAAGIQGSYARIKNLVTGSAEKMPEADFGFKATGEIRTYGQLFGHVANFHYGTCAAVKGVPNPNQGTNLEQTVSTKADVVKALADSFAFCDDAFASLTDQNASDPIQAGRGGAVARLVMLNRIVEHDNEMYGISTVYLRLKNLVPPSTEAQQNRAGGAGRGGQ